MDSCTCLYCINMYLPNCQQTPVWHSLAQRAQALYFIVPTTYWKHAILSSLSSWKHTYSCHCYYSGCPLLKFVNFASGTSIFFPLKFTYCTSYTNAGWIWRSIFMLEENTYNRYSYYTITYCTKKKIKILVICFQQTNTVGVWNPYSWKNYA